MALELINSSNRSQAERVRIECADEFGTDLAPEYLQTE